jgi:hypothetical protein
MRARQLAGVLGAAALAAVVQLSAAQRPAAPTPAGRPAAGQTATPFTVTGPISVPLRFDAYYPYERVGEALRALASAYPTLARLDVIGRSEEGRDIWAMTINNPKTGQPADKPGVYVDGNIHGNEIQAGEVCLYLLNTLLTEYGRTPRITELVDRNVFYVVPVVNVDGRFHFFNSPTTPSSNRTIRVPRDDDRDGLVDEDPPDDLDGDGNICTMRKRDPFGVYRSDPEDPRVMIRVEPGQSGEWTLLGDEGIDNDGDGRLNEDAEGYLDGNRNWGYNWAPPYVQTGSGNYPFEAAPMRAVARFVLDRPNIIAVYAFHNTGGMYLRGPSVKAEEPMSPQDVAVYDLLGRHAEKIVPGYRYLVSWKDLYSTYGDFTDFTYNVAGAYGFVGELFQVETETYRKPGAKPTEGAEGDNEVFGTDAGRERERLAFNDHVAHGTLFKNWTPCTHPVYGDIEVGGWIKMSTRLPHPFMLQELVHRNAAAVLYAAGQTPVLSMEVFGVEKLGAGLYRVRLRIANRGGLPTRTYQTVQKRSAALDPLTVTGPTVRVVAGGRIVDPYRDQVEYKTNRPDVQMVHVPGYGKVEYQFLISGTGEISFRLATVKAGLVTATAALK